MTNPQQSPRPRSEPGITEGRLAGAACVGMRSHARECASRRPAHPAGSRFASRNCLIPTSTWFWGDSAQKDAKGTKEDFAVFAIFCEIHFLRPDGLKTAGSRLEEGKESAGSVSLQGGVETSGLDEVRRIFRHHCHFPAFLPSSFRNFLPNFSKARQRFPSRQSSAGQRFVSPTQSCADIL